MYVRVLGMVFISHKNEHVCEDACLLILYGNQTNSHIFRYNILKLWDMPKL